MLYWAGTIVAVLGDSVSWAVLEWWLKKLEDRDVVRDDVYRVKLFIQNIDLGYTKWELCLHR